MNPPILLWRCPCGAVLTNKRSLKRHVEGKTMCQHRGEGVVSYVPVVVVQQEVTS